jgi:hypothetical protein
VDRKTLELEANNRDGAAESDVECIATAIFVPLS